MPLKKYGVLKGRVVGYIPSVDERDNTPHFTIITSDTKGQNYEVIINVK